MQWILNYKTYKDILVSFVILKTVETLDSKIFFTKIAYCLTAKYFEREIFPWMKHFRRSKIESKKVNHDVTWLIRPFISIHRSAVW